MPITKKWHHIWPTYGAITDRLHLAHPDCLHKQLLFLYRCTHTIVLSIFISGSESSWGLYIR